jgi:hypothetical protein
MRVPEAPVPSPCISVCTMDKATGLCAGCLRTLDEIAQWSVLNEADKRALWQRLQERRLQWQRLGRDPLPVTQGPA